MALDLSALGSISYSLEEMIDRLHEVAKEADEEDEVGIELREVERQLETSSRRLEKAIRQAEQSQRSR